MTIAGKEVSYLPFPAHIITIGKVGCLYRLDKLAIVPSDFKCLLLRGMYSNAKLSWSYSVLPSGVHLPECKYNGHSRIAVQIPVIR